MDIRQIRYLTSAVEGGSLSAAAKRQFVTVQAVSKAISELEAELGAQLLERGNHGVRPTALGTAFYERADRALDAFNDLQSFASAFGRNKNGERMLIALGTPQFLASRRVLGKLDRFIGARLGIKIDTIIASGEECLRILREGNVDAVCTIGDYDSPDTDTVPIGNIPTGLVMASDHPLASSKSLALAKLAPYPVLFSPNFDSFNQSILNVYRERGLKSEIVTISSNEEADEFFLARQGLAFGAYLPAMGPLFPGTTTVPLRPADMERIPLCLVTLKSHKAEAYLELERRASEIFRAGMPL